MTGRPVAVLVVLALLLLTLTGCDPSQGEAPKPAKTAAAPAAVQPGPQQDPGQCVDRPIRTAEVSASWQSETDKVPKIEWTHNGETTPATNLRAHRLSGARGYGGEWSRLVNVHCGDTLGVTLTGTPSNFSSLCAIVDLGDGPVRTGERGCTATYVVP